MNPLTFIFFGRSGSGKGTQAELLIENLKKLDSENRVVYIETGKKFREFAGGASYSSKLTKEVMDTGGLMPEFMPIWIWTQLFIDNISNTEHLVLDGLARRKEEAPVLDSAMKFYKRQTPFVVHIKTSGEWASERLKGRGRFDDLKESDIKAKQDWFDANVIPAMEYFRNNSYYKFLEINGEQSIEDVHKEILEATGLNN